MTLLIASVLTVGLIGQPVPVAPAPKPVKRLYVEFDLAPAVTQDNDPGYKIDLQVLVSGETKPFSCPLGWDEGGLEVTELAQNYFHLLKDVSFDVEVIDKTKIRVYGRKIDGKFHPIVEGKVVTQGLKKEQIPKVKNPPKG